MTPNNDYLEDFITKEEVAEVGMSDLRAELMQKMDYIEELMGGEALLDEIIMGMTTNELKENVEWIAQHHDIKFPGDFDYEYEGDPGADGDWMDANALASAGWGTDEDYGYYGGDEW